MWGGGYYLPIEEQEELHGASHQKRCKQEENGPGATNLEVCMLQKQKRNENFIRQIKMAFPDDLPCKKC